MFLTKKPSKNKIGWTLVFKVTLSEESGSLSKVVYWLIFFHLIAIIIFNVKNGAPVAEALIFGRIFWKTS